MSLHCETYTIETAADLLAGREAVRGTLAWLRIQGHTPETLRQWKLPLTEAVNNAIIHGCLGRSDGRIMVSATVGADGTAVSVRDPGHYVPAPSAAHLNEDPLAESGRGGFLIAHGTDSFDHRNNASGHTLSLRWKMRPQTHANIQSAAHSEDTLDQLAMQLGDAYECVTAYSEFAGLLATTSDFGELLHQVLSRLAETVAHESCVLRFFEGERLVLGAPVDGFPPAIASAVSGVEAKVAVTRNCIALASATELPAGDPLGTASGPIMVVAVGSPRKSHGTLALVRAAGAPAFTAGQIAFTQAVADFLGTAQSLSESWGQRAEQVRLEKEFQLAAKIQEQLLPQAPPTLAGWEISGSCRPSHGMGGDYFDWILRDDGSCFVLVADVMGKGMPAAMVATMLRSAWRTIVGRAESPGELLTELNAQLAPDLGALEVFITAVLVQLSPNAGRMRYANAGHCALLQSQPAGRDYHRHAVGGPPLGIEPRARFETVEVALTRDTTVFAFTDGCYEFDRREGATAGLQRLELELRAATQHRGREVVPAILDRVQALAAGELPDDCTLVAMHYLP